MPKKTASKEGTALTSIAALPCPAGVADAFPREPLTSPVVAAAVLPTALSVSPVLALWNETAE